jgi:hypothetical protein
VITWLLGMALALYGGWLAVGVRRADPGANCSANALRSHGAAVGLGLFGAWLLVTALAREDFGPGGPHVFHGQRSFQLGLGVAAVLWLLPAWWSFHAGPMTVRRRVADLFWLGGLGAALTGLFGVDLLNRQLDRSEAVTRRLEVVDTTSTKERRADRHYFIVVDGGDDGRIGFRTSQPLHARARPGDTLVVRERAGYFGIRWIEPIE